VEYGEEKLNRNDNGDVFPGDCNQLVGKIKEEEANCLLGDRRRRWLLKKNPPIFILEENLLFSINKHRIPQKELCILQRHRATELKKSSLTFG
jgi:hypothetical protein